MDIVRDPINSGDYKREEDPRLFRSTKTGRGPLEDGWRDNYTKAKRGDKPVMTAYKLCRVEFKYWGMQNKIERFIHDVGEFKYRGHRRKVSQIIPCLGFFKWRSANVHQFLSLGQDQSTVAQRAEMTG